MAERPAIRHRHSLLLTAFLLLLTDHVIATPMLEIDGADKKEANNIRDYLQVKNLPCELPQWREPSLRKSLLTDTRKALRAVGYYHPTLELTIEDADKCFNLHLRVDQGVGVMVKTVDIQVSPALAKLEAYKHFRDNLPNSKGQLLEHKLYDQTRNGIEALASRFGFFDGYFKTRKLEVNTDTNDARFELNYVAGERYRLGEIQISGTPFRKNVLDQYILLEQGELFDSRRLIEQQRTLSESAFFKDVEVIALREQRNKDDHTVPVEIRLKQRKRSLHQFGIGASTDIGPKLSYKLDRRWVNDKGHTFGWDTALSPVTRTLTTRYGIPKGDAGKSRLDLQTGYLYEKSDSNQTATFKAAATQTKIIADHWSRSYTLEYLRETFTTGDEEDISEMLIPGIRWYKMRAENRLFPRKGWRLNARIRTALDAMLADSDLFQTTLSFKTIEPLGKGRIISRIDAGVSSVSDFNQVPASLRFFAGGDGSIRGYDYEALGPEDDEGDVIGGRHLLVGSMEYEHPVTEHWGVAAFFDTGNAFNSLSGTDFLSGVGIGVRWHSPLGPIRLDLARGTEPGRDYQLHLSMGTDL